MLLKITQPVYQWVSSPFIPQYIEQREQWREVCNGQLQFQ